MHQYLLTAVHAAALALTVAVSAAEESLPAERSAMRESTPSRLDQDPGHTARFDAATLGSPLVVGVEFPSRMGTRDDESADGPTPALPTLDWQRIGERLDAASGGGGIVPLAFLIRGHDSSNPFEIPAELPPASPNTDETPDVVRASLQRHAIALERALVELLANAREQFPGRPLSIVGLPLNGNTATDGPIAKVLETITSRLDVLVTDRTFLQTTNSVPLVTLRSALPTVVAQADRRPVFYRTPYGWASWQPAPSGPGQPADRHAAGDDDLNSAKDVAPLSERTYANDLASADRLPDDPGRESVRNREHPFGRGRDVADRATLEGPSRVDASSSELGESLDTNPSPEAFSPDVMDFEDEPWLSDGVTDVDGSPNSRPDRSRQGPDEAAAIATPERRGSSGNSVTIPTVNTSPTLLPLLGPMGIDGDPTASLSELLSRLAGSQGSSTGDRSSASRGSTSIGSGTTTGGGGGGASSATSRGGGGGAAFGSHELMP